MAFQYNIVLIWYNNSMWLKKYTGFSTLFAQSRVLAIILKSVKERTKLIACISLGRQNTLH
jgi:hypothetical protein